MSISFDGNNKIISYSVGTTAIDVKDLYSRWKDWVMASGGPFLQGMSVVGGDPIDETAGIYVSTYVFLENGWFIRPAEESHTVKVYNGILLTATGDDPFVPTSGAYNVQIKYSQPVATQAVIVETGVSGLTEEESTQLAEIDVISTKTDGLSGDLGKKLSTGQFLALK